MHETTSQTIKVHLKDIKLIKREKYLLVEEDKSAKS